MPGESSLPVSARGLCTVLAADRRAPEIRVYALVDAWDYLLLRITVESHIMGMEEVLSHDRPDPVQLRLTDEQWTKDLRYKVLQPVFIFTAPSLTFRSDAACCNVVEAAQAYDGVLASLNGVRVSEMLVPICKRITINKMFKMVTSTAFELVTQRVSFVRVAALGNYSETDSGIMALRTLQSRCVLDAYAPWVQKMKEVFRVAAKLDVGAGMSLLEPKDLGQRVDEVFTLKAEGRNGVMH